MKIAFFGISRIEEINFYKENLSQHEVDFFDNPLTLENIPPVKDYDIISIFVNCRVDFKTIDSLPLLKAIFARSTGIDNIDLEYAKGKNIKIFNVPSYGAKTVAEFTFALILTLTRNITKASLQFRNEKKINRQGLRGIDISGKNLGVIGVGNIGRNVINIAKGFNMNILAFDIAPDLILAESAGFKYVLLDELLKNSDIITIHTPANQSSRYLISKENISLLKKTAYLINTARGTVVETQALISALESNSIAGCALDVLENENNLGELEIKLLNMENVLITPHMAFYTKEAEERIAQATLENILKFIS